MGGGRRTVRATMPDPLGPTGLVPRGWRNVADQLRAAAVEHPDKIALQSVDDGRALSWGALAEWAGRLGRFLAARNIAADTARALGKPPNADAPGKP